MAARVSKVSDSEVEILVEISSADFEKHRENSIDKLSENLDIQGFRKGHIPRSVAIGKIGEGAILEEMASRAISEAYPKILDENNLDGIGRPEITITKLAAGNPLEFKVKQQILPEIKLPNYKKIASKVMAEKPKKIEITDGEIDKVIENIRQSRRKDDKIPEANDEFAKSLGNFENMAQFRAKLAENMKLEAEFREKDRRRVDAMEKIMTEIKVKVPDLLIDRELGAIIADMKANAAQMQIDFKEFLKNSNKTEEDLKKEYREAAEKRAKFGLTLEAIAKEENISVDDKEVEENTKKLLSQYPGADKEATRRYATSVLKNEKVFELLESQK